MSEPTARHPDMATFALTVTHAFSVPAERVYDAWLDPKGVGQWLFSTPGGEMVRVEVDPRVGGRFVIAERRGSEIAEHVGTYQELHRPRRIVFTFSTDREQAPTLVTIDIEPIAGGCKLTLTHRMDPRWAAYADKVRSGWTGILEGLAEAVPSDRELTITRVFAAPRELVYKLWADPQHLASWWGPHGFTTTAHGMDFRTRGVWQFTMHGPDGRDYKNKVTYTQVTPPERIIFRHGGDDDCEPVSHETSVFFEEYAGKTRLRMRMLFASPEAREQTIKAYGADEGLKQTIARLDEYVMQCIR